jgi:predicted ATPase
MNKVLVGKNASGKTMYIRNLLKELMDAEQYSFCTNIDGYISSIDEVDNDFVKEINLRIDDFDIKIDESGKGICLNDYSLSDTLANLIKTVVHKVDYVILDEPEVGISEHELMILADILSYCSAEVIMTTHSDILANQYSDELYSEINGELVSIEYENTDCV